MTDQPAAGRLSTLAAAWVVARRDFTAILFSRSFFLFLLGPLFPILIGTLAGGVGQRLQQTVDNPVLGLVMRDADASAMEAARKALAPQIGNVIPEFRVLKRLKEGETADPVALLKGNAGRVAAVLSGTPAAPVLTGGERQIQAWRGPLAVVAGEALEAKPRALPDVAIKPAAAAAPSDRAGRLLTAQAAQTLLFLLTMLLAGMVLSNLVEEKANKIIEILAAAIPMDAVFLGKLFAMLGVSFFGIATWGLVGALGYLIAGSAIPHFTAPAVGWPMMIMLGICYFSMAYLLLGSVFLTIGSLAATVREVQTLSMPVTMMQLMVFFLASFAMTQPGTPVELAAMLFPFSSPFAMLARAAQEADLWPHLVMLIWQAVWVILLIRFGSLLFRKRVMKSGPARTRKSKRAAAVSA